MTKTTRIVRTLGGGLTCALMLALGLSHTALGTPAGIGSSRFERALLWADVNGDGLRDLYSLLPGQGARLLINLGSGAMRDETSSSGIVTNAGVFQAIWEDFDRDGLPDLLQLGLPGANRLWRNLGSATFEDVTGRVGLSSEDHVIRARWLDYDGDTWPDLEIWTTAESRLLYNRQGRYFDSLILGNSGWTPAASPSDSFWQAAMASTDPAGRASLLALAQSMQVSGRLAGLTPEQLLLGASSAFTGSWTATPNGGSLATSACALAIGDQTTGACLEADSTPTLGRLYPLGPEFNIGPAGNVGIGTTTPANRLSVAGTVESTSGGFVFPDGSAQTTALVGGGVPSGLMILSESATPPPSYSAVGWTVNARSPGGWTTRSPMSTPRANAASVATAAGNLFVIGGDDGIMFLNGTEQLDPSTGSWSSKASLSTARNNHAAAELNGRIYVMGGSTGLVVLDSVEEYNPTTDTWTTKNPLTSPRSALSAAVLGGKLYLIGGGFGVALSTCEQYDPATDTWIPKAPMPTPRFGIAAATLGGKIYVTGGTDASAQTDSVEAYDPVTDTWATLAPMLSARTHHGAAALNGKLYVLGGSDGSNALSSVEEYDPVTDTWTTLPSMSTTRGGIASSALGGSIYAVGGINAGGVLDSVEALDFIVHPLHLHRKD